MLRVRVSCTVLISALTHDIVIISLSLMARTKKTAQKTTGERGQRISLHHLQMKEQRAAVVKNAPCHSKHVKKQALEQNLVSALSYMISSIHSMAIVLCYV